jgi:hypothetical protein
MKSQDITHLMGRFLVKDHIDARQDLAGDGAHGNAVGLASPDLALEVLLQVGVEAAGGVGGRPPAALKGKWRVEEERAMRCLEKDLPPCLVYLCFRVEWHKAIRTTNLVERVFREVRRRTRPMGVFGNVEGESVCHAGGDTGATQLLRSPGGVADLRDRHGR